jgi:hypothetical protein
VTGNLSINTPKSFQLAFNWIFTLLVTLALVFVATYYLRSQNTFLAALQQETFVVGGGGGDGGGNGEANVDDDDNNNYGAARARVHTKQLARQSTMVRSKYSVLK